MGPTSPDALDGGFGDTRAVVGYPVGTNLLVPYAGIDPATGKPLYYDANGNLTFKYDPNNRKPVGDIFPLFTGGITNTFTYKNFDLNFLFVYSYGGKIYDDAAKRQRTPIVPDDLLFNQTKEVLDYWTKPGDMTSKPRPTMVGSTYGLDQIWQNNTNGYVEDASYIRLRNLTFGYTFKTKSKYVANPRIYFTGTNLLLFTNYKGWDPEVGRERENEQQRNVGGTNVTFLTPPQERSYVFGFDISF